MYFDIFTLILTGEPLDVVDLRHRRVRAVRYDLSGRVRVPASTTRSNISIAGIARNQTTHMSSAVRTENIELSPDHMACWKRVELYTCLRAKLHDTS